MVLVQANEKYGKLSTIEVVGKTKNRERIWRCKCDCGNFINVPASSLTSGNTKSCGCLKRESARKKGVNMRIKNKYDLSGDYGIGYTLKGEEFYFDKEDYDKIKNYTWHLNDSGYVMCGEFGKNIRMHRIIMGDPKGKDVDHINHNTVDNRKANLRIVDHYQNVTYSKMRVDNTTGKKGVYWDKNRNKWMALITYDKRSYHLGRFDTFEEAVSAREKAEISIHKEFNYDEENKKPKLN